MITSFFKVKEPAVKKRKRESEEDADPSEPAPTKVAHSEKVTTETSVVDKNNNNNSDVVTQINNSSTETITVAKESPAAKADLQTTLLSPTKVSVVPVLSDSVNELISTLKEPSWTKALQKYFARPDFGQLADFVKKERSQHTIFPPANLVWTALNVLPIDKIKVIIVGQDPYHGPGQAHGLAFSVLPGNPIPPSLRNIYIELGKDVPNFVKPNHGHLLRWAHQGVLLLNNVLTVRSGQATSHKNKGWEGVTDEILRQVNKVKKDSGLVLMLWGIPAKSKASFMAQQSNKHKIIFSSHPSPLAANKTNTPFLGSKCFSRCNKELVKMGLKPIDWNVDGPLPAQVE